MRMGASVHSVNEGQHLCLQEPGAGSCFCFNFCNKEENSLGIINVTEIEIAVEVK